MPYGDRYERPGWLQGANVPDSYKHGASGGKAIVNEDGLAGFEAGCLHAAAIEVLAATQLGLLAGNHVLTVQRGDLQLADNSHVENLGGIGNGAHREFGLPGDAELNRRQLSTRTVSLTAKTTLHNPKTTLHNPKISSFFLEPVKVCPARFPKTAI